MPSSSTGFLHALGSATGSASRTSVDAGCLQAGRGPPRRGRGLDQHALARLAHHVERRAQLVGRRQGHGVAHPGHGAVGDLAAIHVEIDMAVAVQQSEAERERRARHVAAAHIQQPGDRIGLGQQRHVGALGGDATRRSACAALRCSRRRTPPGAAARARAARPDDRAIRRRRDCDSTGTKLPPALAQARAKRSWPSTVCSHGIEAELAALRQVFGDPGVRRLLGNLVRHEGLDVDLRAHRQRVAAVDEDRSPVGQHDGEAGRAGEAGQPGQALRVTCHVLALVLIGARHDEAVQAAPLQFGAQRRQPLAGRRRFAKAAFGPGEFCPPRGQRLGQFGIGLGIDQLDPFRPGQSFRGCGNAAHQGIEGGGVEVAATLPQEMEDVVGS